MHAELESFIESALLQGPVCSALVFFHPEPNYFIKKTLSSGLIFQKRENV